MVNLTRLFNVERERLYRIFSITDSGLVTLLMKMTAIKTSKHENYFCYHQSNMRQTFASQKDFAIASHTSILKSDKHSAPGSNAVYSKKAVKSNRSQCRKNILRNVRIFKMHNIFDSITFDKSILDSIESLLTWFEIGTSYSTKENLISK